MTVAVPTAERAAALPAATRGEVDATGISASERAAEIKGTLIEFDMTAQTRVKRKKWRVKGQKLIPAVQHKSRHTLLHLIIREEQAIQTWGGMAWLQHGNGLLAAIQAAAVFPDCKAFV